MYSVIDVISPAIEQAKKDVYIDRNRYNAIMVMIERFAVDNGLIASGKSATKITIPTEADPTEDYVYEFLSPYALMHAKKLTDTLYAADPEGLCQFASMHTKAPNYHFTINVNNRDVCAIYSLPRHHKAKFSEIVSQPRPCRWLPGENILCASVDLQLITAYMQLCNPEENSSWETVINTQNYLRDLRRSKTSGGRESHDSHKKKRSSQNVLEFMQEYAAGPGRVVVGEAAAQLWASNFKTEPCDVFQNTKHLSVIANANLDEEGLLIATIAAKHDLTVEWAVKDPFVPVDIRLRRLTVYTMAGRIRVDTLLDVYNSATYDLIPYKPHGDYKIGSLFTVMRFLLVEKWLVEFLHMIGAIPTTSFTEKIDRIFATVSDKVDELMNSDDVEKFEQLMPLKYYIGRLESMTITLRRIQNQEKKFYSPYYPVSAQFR